MASAPNVATFTAIMDHGQFDAEVGKMKNSAEQAGTAAANAGQSFSNTAKKTGAFSSSAKNLGGKLKDLEPTIGRAASGLSGMAGALGGAVGQTNALGGAVAGLAGAFAGGGLLAVGIGTVTLLVGYLAEQWGRAGDEAEESARKQAAVTQSLAEQIQSKVESQEADLAKILFGTEGFELEMARIVEQVKHTKAEILDLQTVTREDVRLFGGLGAAQEAIATERAAAEERLFSLQATLANAQDGYEDYLNLRKQITAAEKKAEEEKAKEIKSIKDLTRATKEKTAAKEEEAKVTARIISIEKIDDDLKGSFEDFDELRKEEARALEDQRKQRLRLFAQAAQVQKEQAKEEERIQKEKLKNIEDAEKESQERKLAELRVYTGEAASLINGAFALSLDALEAVAAGEKVMLHEMIIAYTTSTMKQAGIRIFGSGLATFIEGMLANSFIPGSGANAVSSGAVAMGIGASLGAGGAVGSGLATRFGIVGGGDAAPGGMTPGVNGGNISAGGSRGRSEESGEQRNVYVFNSPVYSDLTETAKNASRLQKIARDDLLERV